MLPRSLFLIVAASCWLQINAVSVETEEDYQSLQDDGEDLLDYAFTDNDGASSVADAEIAELSEVSEASEISEAADETTDKASILETIKDTMETMDKLGVLKDKQNINVNANSPKYKKKSKKTKSTGRKRTRPKPDDNDDARRSTQQFEDISVRSSREITERERNIVGAKSRNYCNTTRRSNLNNYSQTTKSNSSYLGIDEDFTIKSREKMKKTHAVFTDDYITLCWVEITTIKQDNSIKPPKRLILREYKISYENAAAIPDEYLSCPAVDGDITLEDTEAVCNTNLGENIGDDTQISRIVNLTRKFRENNIDIQVNKVIKCAMGSVITKDIFRWPNPSESTRQRVVIGVSPEIHSTNASCSKYQKESKLKAEAPRNESAECSDESKEGEIDNSSQLGKGVTECLGESCSDVDSHESIIKPLNVSKIHSPLTTTDKSSTRESSDIVTQPSIISLITNQPGTKKPLHVSEAGSTVSQSSVIPEIDDVSHTKEPLQDDHPQTKKPLYLWRPRVTASHAPVHSWSADNLVTTKSPDSHELIDSSSSEEVEKSYATRKPKFLDDSEPEFDLPHHASEIPCTGPDCPKNITEKPSSSDLAIGYEKPHNITKTSDEESCEGSDCKDIEYINDAEMSEVENLLHEKENATSSSEELAKKETASIYIPKTFVCPVNNKLICDHLERVAKLQKEANRSSAESIEEMVHGLEKILESNETSSSEEMGVELGDIVPMTSTSSSIMTTPSHTVSTMSNSQSSSLEHTSPSLVNSKPKLIYGTDSHESESLSSSEIINDEMKTILSSEEASWAASSSSLSSEALASASVIKPSVISINQTQEISDASSSEELLNSSSELEKNFGSNETEHIKSCDETGNCYEANTSYTNRISPSFSTVNGEVTPLIQNSVPTSTVKSDITEEGEESDESCDCDEESDESKKCNPDSETCEHKTSHSSEEKLITPPMLDAERASPDQLRTLSTVSGRHKPTSSPISERDEVKGTGTEALENKSKNHKLSLKIHVTLEHIDENYQNSQLAQVEKDVLLNELPEQHGNHSLYWHIQALNRSANDAECLRDLFNCTILQKLTEEAIMNQLNITESSERTSNLDDEFNRRRYRRSIENATAASDSKNDNETLISSSVLRDLILPHIREDIKIGLADMLDHILAALNRSRSDTSEKSIDVPTSTAKNADATTESLDTTTVANRMKRSLMSESDASDVEELSQWSNERFIPSNDGAQLRSFTELKILRNFVGVK